MIKQLVYTFLIFILPVSIFAKGPEGDEIERSILQDHEHAVGVWGLDSIPAQRGARNSRPGNEKEKPDKGRPEIKEVPKSRRQLKPGAVVDRVKGKPVKLPNPKGVKLRINFH